jgi:hypothetical protein
VIVTLAQLDLEWKVGQKHKGKKASQKGTTKNLANWKRLEITDIAVRTYGTSL